MVKRDVLIEAALALAGSMAPAGYSAQVAERNRRYAINTVKRKARNKKLQLQRKKNRIAKSSRKKNRK